MATPYYSVTSEGGTRYVRRKHRRPDGTYSDSESCPSDVDVEAATARAAKQGKGGKKGKKSISEGKEKEKGKRKDSEKEKKSKGKGGKKGGEDSEDENKKRKGKADRQKGEDADDEDSDYSLKSVVSEGGTRRKMKMKRIRDEDGNVVGYGDAIPADVRASSVTGRRGNRLVRLFVK
ncbi:cylicin-2 [Aplysia californica]|uniref:Cylicin-2 n=1 Tax=Aplysia californica TaxID=6500 RepID=A0ABM1ADG0_APLCA|nr:cylicin-2 [Aplysia californica]